MMDNDDALIGQVLSRREMVALFGGLPAVAFLAACADDEVLPAATATGTQAASIATQAVTGAPSPSATAAQAAALPSCIVRPALTEGPYFVDEKLNRSDIRSDPSDNTTKDGALLTLAFNVSRIAANGCNPLAGASVDVWQCDAAGTYSDAQDASFNTRGKKFLRGYQVTDATGKAQFTTIYPGYYPGRTVHIHFKVRTTQDNRAFDFTSQLFFDDAFSDQVFTRVPYNTKGPRGTRNANDGIYRQAGSQLLLDVKPSASGYAATFDIGLQM